jgi:hypothetical protein
MLASELYTNYSNLQVALSVVNHYGVDAMMLFASTQSKLESFDH